MFFVGHDPLWINLLWLIRLALDLYGSVDYRAVMLLVLYKATKCLYVGVLLFKHL